MSENRTFWKCENCGRKCKLEIDIQSIGIVSPIRCVINGEYEEWIKVTETEGYEIANSNL